MPEFWQSDPAPRFQDVKVLFLMDSMLSLLGSEDGGFLTFFYASSRPRYVQWAISGVWPKMRIRSC